jgi:hypothetical protein
MLRLRQICLAVPDIGAAEQLAHISGAPICHRDPLVGSFGLENALLAFGPTFVEFVAPIADGTTATRFLAKHPHGGGYMIILDCDELPAMRKHVESLGVRIALASDPAHREQQASDPKLAAAAADYAGFSNIQLHPRDVGGTLLELNWTEGSSKDLYGPYAPAGRHWVDAARRTDTPRLAAVEVTSPEPNQLATRWSQLLRKESRFNSVALDVGKILFAPGTATEFARVIISGGDRTEILRRARAHNCDTSDTGFSFAGMRFDLAAPG